MTAPAAPPSLRRQLAWRLALGLLAAWLAAVAGAGLVIRHRIDRIFDAALQETAERILPLAIMEIEATRLGHADRRPRADEGERHDDDEDHDEDDHDAPRTVRRLPQAAPHPEALSYVLRDRRGRMLIRSHDADPADFDPTASQGMSVSRDSRLYTRSTEGGGYTIQAVEPLSVRREALRATLGAMLLPLALAIPLALAGIRLILRRSLRPVDRLSAELGRRGAQDLSPIPAGALPAELVPIREAANRLFGRMSRALEAERGFSANAAHELRTPIAATLAQTQRLVREAPQGPLRDRALTVEAELKRMARLAEKLLQLARVEGGGVLADAPSDLAPVLAAVLADLGRDLPPGRILASLPDAPVMSHLDPDVFGVLARNLIENALRHGTPGTAVEVALTARAVLRVANDCPLLPPETLARLTTRFERAGSRAFGSGLGLTIVAAVAQVLGTELRMTSPRPGSAGGIVSEIALKAEDQD
ncbi:ATP-binding protein [Paracoccus contaminans]|uniref:histidine kinase n=1 Tax=Paracoccus contaminans TaxID=1945662 RepID=A0A1W6CXX0_9RHOB|nr:ATP-binding protein [Paracoccus contaminans]ARJ69727.1 hypothetical protein B0A89_08925 [Paracoccus contaminans]